MTGDKSPIEEGPCSGAQSSGPDHVKLAYIRLCTCLALDKYSLHYSFFYTLRKRVKICYWISVKYDT